MVITAALLGEAFGVGLLLVEDLVPSTEMAVAALDGGERGLMETLDGLAVPLGKRHRDECLDAGPAAFVLLHEGENDTSVPFDLAVLSAHPERGGFGLDAGPPRTARAEVEVEARAGEIPGAIQRIMSSRFSQRRKTSETGASNVRTISSSSSPRSVSAFALIAVFLRDLGQIGVHPVEAFLPEATVASEPVIHLLQRPRLQPARPPLRFAPARSALRSRAP